MNNTPLTRTRSPRWTLLALCLLLLAACDTVLETDAEQFLLTKDAQAGVVPPFFAGMESITMLLESACIEKPPEDFRGGPTDIMRLIGPTVEAALVDHRGDPQKSYVALARILQDLKPDMVMSAFPAARQQELKDAPPEQVAGEFIEDTAIQWAVQKLASAPVGTEAIVVEEDVVRVLVRSLQATRMANRMATKLAKFVQEHVFPPSTYKRIQDELKWVGIPTKQKLEELMKVERFGLIEFRRMVELIRDLLKDQKHDEASQLAGRYFNVLEAKEIQPEELGRGPELITLMGPVRATGFARTTAERLCAALLRDDLNQFVHFQVANCMVALAKMVAIYEDYDIVQMIGTAMEKSAPRDPAVHVKCCQGGLPQLLPEKAIERMVELLLEKKDDAAWVKSALGMIRWSGQLGIEKLFTLLEHESQASNRMVLMRFIGQMGAPALDHARQRLQHKHWYVVRNACKLLGDLKDPDLLADLAPALQHPDERVQQAALAAINKNRVPGRALAIADALPYFGPHVLDQVLEELMFLRDPATVPALERYIFVDGKGKTKAAEKAVQALAGQQSEQSAELLGNVLAAAELEMPVRRAALHALRKNKSEAAIRALTSFVEKSPDDPLARESQKALSATH